MSGHVLTKRELPKSIKDIPWFIGQNYPLRLWNIDGYLHKKDKILSFMFIANSEPECFMFHDWLIDNYHVINLDVSFNNFNVVLNPLGRKKYANIYQLMANTMDKKLLIEFIGHGKWLERDKEKVND